MEWIYYFTDPFDPLLQDALQNSLIPDIIYIIGSYAHSIETELLDLYPELHSIKSCTMGAFRMLLYSNRKLSLPWPSAHVRKWEIAGATCNFPYT